MKKILFIIIILVSLYLHFYPNEKLNTWVYENASTTYYALLIKIGVSERFEANNIYKDLSQDIDQFTGVEQLRLDKITRDNKSALSFYKEHCKINNQAVGQATINNLSKSNLKKVCQVIDKHFK